MPTRASVLSVLVRLREVVPGLGERLPEYGDRWRRRGARRRAYWPAVPDAQREAWLEE
jgi:hypothetical protein